MPGMVQQPAYLIPGIPSAMGNDIIVRTDASGNLQALTPGTGVLSALGSAINGSGGFVGFNGNIGAASGTSLALGGAIIGTNALAITGTAAISSNLTLSSLTAGSVPYIGTNGLVTQNNNNFFWDNSVGVLGIGRNTLLGDGAVGAGLALGAAGGIFSNSVGGQTYYTTNAYYQGAWKSVNTLPAVLFVADAGNNQFVYYNNAAGAAGRTITWNPFCTFDFGNNSILVNTATPWLQSSGRSCVTINGSASTTYTLCVGDTPNAYFLANGTEVRLFTYTASLPLKLGTNNTEYLGISGAGDVTVYNLAGSGNRAVYSDPNGVLTNSSSDAALKTNVALIENALNKVRALRGVSFNWKDTARFGTQKEIGFIAQEVQPIVPEVVGVNHDGTLSLDYPKLTALLVEAMHELEALIGG